MTLKELREENKCTAAEVATVNYFSSLSSNVIFIGGVLPHR